jgi:hypothetical protein
MPFELRILDKIKRGGGVESFGRIAEPIMTLESNHYPISIGLIELDLYGIHNFYVEKTWILDYNNRAYKFYQSLRINLESSWFGDLYLIGYLVDENPKSVKLYIGDFDPSPKELLLPFIPKTNEDYISYEDKVYRTKNVIYKKNEIALIVDQDFFTPVGEFERLFFNQYS